MQVKTWKQMAEAINSLPEEQQNMNIQTWSENTPLSEGVFCITTERHYFADDWDSCYPESKMEITDFENSTTLVCVAEIGEPYIWFD